MPRSIKDGDYILKDGKAWLEVKGFAIWVRATDEGVVVDIYKNEDELGESLASTYAFDSETEDA
jgi:hypothetical protein